jgi:hypothetical protein
MHLSLGRNCNEKFFSGIRGWLVALFGCKSLPMIFPSIKLKFRVPFVQSAQF